MGFENDIEKYGFSSKGWNNIISDKANGKKSTYSDIDDDVYRLLGQMKAVSTGNGLPDLENPKSWPKLMSFYKQLVALFNKSKKWHSQTKKDKKVCAAYIKAVQTRQDVLADWAKKKANAKGDEKNAQAAQNEKPQPRAAAQQPAQKQQAQRAQDQAAEKRQHMAEKVKQQRMETPQGPEDVYSGEIGYEGGEAKPANMAAEQEKLWKAEKKQIEKLDLLLSKSSASIKAEIKKAEASVNEAVRYLKAAEKKFNDTVGKREPGIILNTFETDLETMETRFGYQEKAKDIMARTKELVSTVRKLNGHPYKSHQAKKEVRSDSVIKGFEGLLTKYATDFAQVVAKVEKAKETKVNEKRAAVEAENIAQ